MTVDPVWDDYDSPLGEPEDGADVERAISRVGQTDESGFKPSVMRPIPGQQCTATVKNGEHAGERCRRRAIYGHWICLMHGGGSPAVRKKAEAIVQAARMRLIDNTQVALEVIEDLANNGTSEAVRLKAATEILDRAGVRGGVDVDVTVTQGADPAVLLRERLQLLKARQDEDIQDAEVVDPAEDDVTVTESADNDLKE